jgi:helix-turn-helix protein
LIHEEVKFTIINVQKYGKEQDLEIAAVQIRLHEVNVIIISIYRAPKGNFDYFLKALYHILQFHHKNNIEFVTCGDINVDYLENNREKVQLNNMLKTYNLTSTVYFPTKTTNISVTLIDNIFINYTRNYNVNLCVNGLSDHDAQLITVNITITKGSMRSVNIREINKESIKEFQFLSSWEQCVMVCLLLPSYLAG